MSKVIDRKVVEMEFDNSRFEKNVNQSITTLERLKNNLNFIKERRSLDKLQQTANSVDVSGIGKGIEVVQAKFSALQIVGMTCIQELTRSAINMAKSITSSLTDSLINGGKNRALNIQNAKFQIRGLLGEEEYAKQWDRIDESINYAVKDTAYGYDSAAKAASQFLASNVKVGEQMDLSLRAISGVAAMTNSSYDDIANVFTRVAGQGRVMANDLNSLAARGLNAAATLGKSLNKTEAEVRDMTSKGQISFEMFAKAMDDAYGEHAKKGNETFEGALANTKAAMSRIGAKVWDPMLTNMRDVLNQARILINDFNNNYLDDSINKLNNRLTSIFNYIVKFFELGGVKNIFIGLGNAIRFVGEILSPIGKAFKEVFPPIAVERLVQLTERFKKFTENLKVSAETAEKIRVVFKALFSVVKTGITIFAAVAGAAFKILTMLFPVGNSILSVIQTIATYLQKLIDAFWNSNIVIKLLDSIVHGIQTASEKINKFVKDVLKFDKIITFFQRLFTVISTLGLAIVKFIGSVIHNGDLKKAGEALNTGLFGGILITVNKLLKNLNNITRGFKDIGSNINGTLRALKGVLIEFQTEIKSKTLINIAKAVALLAGSLFVLSLIPSDKIGSSLGAMAGVLTEFMLAFWAWTKMSDNVSKAGRSTVLMVGMATSILIMATALKKLGGLDWSHIFSGLTGLAGAMTILIVAMQKMPNQKHIIRNATGMIIMATAINIMASALKKFGSINFLDICKGLLAMAGSLFIVTKAMNKLPKNTLTKSAGMLTLSISLVILAKALKQLGTMSWSDILRSLTALGGALTILTIVMNNMPTNKKTSKSKTSVVSLIGMTTSMVILAVALKKLATLSWDDIKRSLVAMGGAMAILVTTCVIMSKAKASTAGLLSASAALVIFALGMRSLSKISWDGLTRAFVGLAGGVILLVAAAYALSPVATTLLAVAGAMALFGVGVAAFGAGLMLISGGIMALAGALSGGATIIVAGLGAIILGILGLIPEIVQIAKLFIIGLLDAIIEIAPKLAKAIGDVLLESVKMLEYYVPLLVTGILNMLIKALRALADRIPELIVSIAEVLQAIFRGFIEALELLDKDTLAGGIKALGMLTGIMLMLAALGATAPAAMAGVLAFGVLLAELSLVLKAVMTIFSGNDIANISTAGNILQAIGTAIGQFIGGIIGGFGAGVTASLPSIGDNLSKFMKNLQPFLQMSSNIEPNILGKISALSGAILILSAANFISGLANLLSFGNSLPKLGNDLGLFMKNAKPFIDGALIITPSLMKGVTALAGAIMALTGAKLVNSITSFITGGDKSFAKFGKQISNLGKDMKNFVNNLGTFNDSQVKTIEAACSGIKALAEASKKIPNEGGVWGWLAGDNSIGTFSKYLPGLGKNLNTFVANLGTFSDAQVTTVGAAANAIKTLAGASKEIPNEGGVWGWLAGDNSIGDFAEKLPIVGSCLSTFAKNLGEFTDAQVTAVSAAAKAIASMAKAAKDIPNSGGLVSLFTGDNDILPFAGKLPLVALGLKGFVNNLGSFTEEQTNAAYFAAKCISKMAQAAKDIPNSGGLVSLFTGDNDILPFAGKLPSVGASLKGFVDSLGTFSEEQVTTADCAGRAIAALGKAAGQIPAEGSCFENIFGKKSLAEFADKLPRVANGLSQFVSGLGTFSEEQVTTADCAGRAIAALGKAAGDIPAEEGLWQKIVGKKSLAEFADKLPGVATNIASFVTNLGTFTDDQVTTVSAGAKAIVEFAKAGQDIPNSGGLVSLFTGDNDIKTFAEKLPQVGTALGNFVKNIGIFSQPQLDTVNAATNAMKALTKFDDVDTDNVNKVLTSLSSNLSSFGTKLSDFATGLKNVSSEDINSAIAKMNDIIKMAKEASNINAEALNSLNTNLSTLGTNAINGFIKAFTGEEPKENMSRGIRDLVDKMISTFESKRTDLENKCTSIIESCVKAIKTPDNNEKFESCGLYFVQGFANGIKNNKYLVVDASTSLGNAAYNAAKKAIDAHSPSKKSFKLGNFFGLGFVNGISEYEDVAYSVSKEVADKAKRGMATAVNTINQLLDADMYNQPTIRPVLDLSDVKSEAGKIGGMFDNVTLGANINAVSTSMNRRSQNGTNEDIVSAINKLGSNLGHTGDTYNINGINYSSDSEIADAVRSLIRAANIERRA